MPTLSFFIYLLSVGLVWVFRIGYHGWFGLYLFLAILSVPIMLVLLSLPAIFAMQLELKAPDFLTKNETGELMLKFSSRHFLPLGQVRLQLSQINHFTGESKKNTLNFHGLCSTDRTFPFETKSCGQIAFQIDSWECRDLLGFFRFRKKALDSVSCTILPLPVAPDQAVDFDVVLSTSARLKPKYGGGFAEEHDLRDYRPGDASNSIHWKLSSKTDKLIVREALEQDNKDVFLILSQTGIDDRGLEVLYWLSLELIKREQTHYIVANQLYLVANEKECVQALSGVLASPMRPPCGFDASRAKSIFRVSSGEVTAL